MNELIIFDSPEFGTVRTLDENGDVLFCGADVATALGYSKPQNAIATHCRGALKRGIPHPQSPDKTIEMLFIPESDLYRLVFSSKLPTAEKFTDWVTKEVLPSIRKTGVYGLPQDYPSALRALADEAERHQETRQLLEKERADKLEMAALACMLINSEDFRKVRYYDDMMDKNLLTSLRETANLLQVKEKEFIRWMIAGKFLYRGRRDKLRPYASRIEEGLFATKEVCDEDTGRARVQTLVTPKGRDVFLRLMDKGVFGVLYKAINLEDYL